MTAGGCVAAGAAFLLCAASVSLRGWLWQERNADLFNAADAPELSLAGVSLVPGPGRPPARGEALARLRIQRLGLETVVAEGDDPATLLLGPGHMEGSALPGEPDNCIIAGHRDGPFRRLRTTRPGDVVEIALRTRVSRYRVDSVRTVPKDDAGLLAPSRSPILTLVTCYPFEYVGHAPRRFVVRATLLDEAGDRGARADARTGS